MLRSLAGLLIALALAIGPEAFRPFAVECPRCTDHCPMKKRELPCHSKSGSHLPCHSGPRLAAGACTHPSPTAPLSRELALLVPPRSPLAIESTAILAPLASPSPQAPTLEPPIDPPRFWFAV